MLLNDMEGMEVRTPSKFDMEDMEMEMEAKMAPSKFDFEDMESRSAAASEFGSFTCRFDFEDAKFNVKEEYEVDNYEIIGD